MNQRTVLFLSALALALLACRTTANAPVMALKRDTPASVWEQKHTPAPEWETCYVKTNAIGGVLNLRSCRGTSCAVIAYLAEGEPLTVLERGAWLKVETVSHKRGYVNSNFCEMEDGRMK
jgi:hypothetical protein